MSEMTCSMEWINEKFKIYQPREGYRFSMDSLLLAAYAKPPKKSRVLDIGTGAGVIPLVLLSKDDSLQITGVEIQEALAQLAKKSVEANRLSQITVLHQDARSLSSQFSNQFHLVISNPPYFRQDAAILSNHPVERLARHEINLCLDELFMIAYRTMRPKGHFCCIYPVGRFYEVMLASKKAGIHPIGLRMIHSKREKPARAFLFRGGKDAGKELMIEKPLILHEDNGEYTLELRRVLQGGTLDG